MPFPDCLNHVWFPFAQTGILTAGLLLIGVALLFDARSRRVANLIQLSQQHRDLWERMYLQPELTRILDPKADLTREAMTAHEETFVVFIILHLSNTYYAMRSGFFRRPHGLRKDIERFFSLPIPRSVWEKMKILQDPSFVNFVERWLPPTDFARYG